MKAPKVLIFSFYIVLLMLYGCSTTNHAVLPKQAYHDITSHYNAYFNTHEKLKDVFKLSETSHKDKFDSVLPVYYYNDPKEFASYTGDLDDVVKHSTLAIQLHMPSNWTDDHFLQIGECDYLKGDYDKASNSFKYITTEFKEGVDYVKVMKKLGKKVGKYVHGKKPNIKPEVKVVINKDGVQTLEKVDKRPSVSIWIHTPARSMALVWLIKTYTRQKKYDQASSIVTYVRNDDLFYRNFDPDLDLAEADLKVSRKDYAGAIAPLESYVDAKKFKKHKHRVVRQRFVLAQCYQATGNAKKAIDNYKLVLKSNPTTEMEFYAKLKLAKLSRASADNDDDVKTLLTKMSRDKRYRDYWDQVYYELALLALNENKRDDARALLHKSINTSTTNQDQKAVSFLKLAQLDYEDEAYVTSKYFYDSTLTFMAKNDDRYEDISERDKMLDNLVKQLTIIHDEDSLQKMAALPKEEIDKRIKEALAQKEKEDEEKKEAAEAAKQQNMVSNPNNTSQNGSQGSNWYFYSTTARANGYNDFIRKWGRRNLEENWRRKDKSSTTSDEDNTTTETTDTTASKKDTVEAVKGTPEEQMYAAIPDTKEKMDRSVDRIVDAYYAAGTIYKDGLESYGKARDMFEALNERYPGHKLLLESYYNLYLIALKLKQPDKMEYYKKLILDKFPESVIGKVLRDPNYINQARKKEQAIDDYYQSTYEDYDNNRLDSAWIKCEMSNTVFKPNPLSAKFDLLEAMILMKENRLGDYVQALNKIINRSSDVAIKKTATDLLANLNKSKMPQIDLSKDPARRDSLNALYKITPQVSAGSSESSAKPDTAEMTLLQKLEAAKELAIKQGKFVDTTAKANTSDTTAKGTVASNDTASNTNAASNVVEEDTTSPYKRSDAAAHYFIVYIKDPQAPQSAVMSILAKVNAFNSLQFSDKRLQGKYTLIDSKNRTLNVRQFLNREDAMQYFSAIKGQTQLFDDLKPEQYTITVISSSNFITLLSNKNIDEYMKFFNRIYK